MAADTTTKQSGVSPGKVTPKASLVTVVKGILGESVSKKRITSPTFPINMQVGKGYAVTARLPTKLLLYLEYTESSISTALNEAMNDAWKRWVPVGGDSKTEAEVAGISKSPNTVKQSGGSSRIRKKATIVLPIEYPITEIGGNTGSKDGVLAKRKGRRTILARIPSTVPMVSFGIALAYLAANAPKSDRKIGEFKGPTGSVTYAVPIGAEAITDYEKRLAVIKEVSDDENENEP